MGGGTPVHVLAAEQWAEDDPVVRMLPDGFDAQARAVWSQRKETSLDAQRLGIPVGEAKLRLVVQAKDADVLLTGLRLVVEHRDAPLQGTLVFVTTEGGGEPIQVRFDADAPEAQTSGVPAHNLKGGDYFDGGNVQLVPDEIIEFRVWVTTRNCYCRWRLDVDVVKGGRLSTVEVRRGDGQPFEITAATPKPGEVYTIPHPSDPPKRKLGSIGPWVKVPVADFCAGSRVCDSREWPEP